MSEVVTRSDETIGIWGNISEASIPNFRIRYSGLAQELHIKGMLALFAYSNHSYDPNTHSFETLYTATGEPVKDVRPVVARNLSLGYEAKPIYEDPEAPRLVHDTDFNRFVSRKDKVAELLPEVHPITIVTSMAEVVEAAAEIPGYRVIVKPVTGLLSRGVRVVRKKDLKPTAEQGNYLVQEYIDTSRGDQDLGIEGVHNLRLYSIDSNLVGAVAKVGGQRKSMLIKAAYGGFFTPEDLPAEVHAVAEQVHGKLKQLPGDGRNVIAIDLMRGRSSTRQDGYVICEINERPYRISSADIGDPDIYNPNDMMWLAKEWDKAEAEMLTSIIKQEVGK